MDTLELLRILEERLEQHDNSRKEVQNKLQKIHSGILAGAASLEEKINEATHETFNTAEERILGIINKLNAATGESNLNGLIQQAQKELSTRQRYEVKQAGSAANFSELYTLSIVNENINGNIVDFNGEGDATKKAELAASKLQEHLESVHESMVAAQDRVAELCTRMREEADGLNSRINEKLEYNFKQEDARLQEFVKLLREKASTEKTIDVKNLDERLASALFIIQKYSLDDPSNVTCPPDGYELREPKEASLTRVNVERSGPTAISTLFMDKGKLSVTIVKYSLKCYELSVLKEASLTCINFEGREPTALSASFTDKGELSIAFTFFSDVELSVLKLFNLTFDMDLSIWEKGSNEEDAAKALTKKFSIGTNKLNFINRIFAQNTTYYVKARINHNGSYTQWSSKAEFVTPKFKTSAWKECTTVVNDKVKYFLDENNPRIATKACGDDAYCTIIGNLSFSSGGVISWNVKVLRSKREDRSCIYVGVAPYYIDQNVETYNYSRCGWYFYSYTLVLWSGPPHNYKRKRYGPRKVMSENIVSDNYIGVVMDTKKGELSFVLDGVNYGVAYEEIPLDEPLVPCVLLKYQGDSVELDASGVREVKADVSVSVPRNVMAKSETWDSITLTWDEVEGASFYRIEVGGNGTLDVAKNMFTNKNLLPETEYSFRVLSVNGSLMSEWSPAIKGKTLKKSFETSGWKKCPDSVDKDSNYTVDNRNPRIVRKNGNNKYCIAIGNTQIPLDAVTPWNIKILEQKHGKRYIYIGVAPSDINQNIDTPDKCGWYLDCHDSTLRSGPPHNYKDKEYGPRRVDEQYVHTGDSVGVVMDATKGELSFVLNGVNYGVAYEGIPLDKPLVSCVILVDNGEAVEFITSEIKETMEKFVPVPSKIKAKGYSCDSITLTWDSISDVSSYRIEVNGIYSSDVATTNTYTKTGLLPGTKYSFRVRTVMGSSVSKWSSVVKGKTLKESSGTNAQKKLPGDVNDDQNWIVDKEDLMTVISTNKRGYNVYVKDTRIPSNTVASWNVKVMKSYGNGKGIYVGVMPQDVNSKEDDVIKCGWYLNCYLSTLCSGPPHNYDDKVYGAMKGEGQHVQEGDSVGVLIDTIKGELSFILDRVNRGVAYGGIPLDKPLVPCVILNDLEDSVIFDTFKTRVSDPEDQKCVIS